MSEDGVTVALDDTGLRRVVTVLSTVQIVSWGVLYYGFAALQASIMAETGWSSIAVTGAFSLSQLVSGGVGICVGRRIDATGPRMVMTAASVVAIPAVATVAVAPNLATFYLGWALTGVAMAGTLYPPAFAALTHWGGERRVRALTTLTLVAGLASTVFVPLAGSLDDWLGWRQAYLVLLAGMAVITIPLHWWGLNQPWRRNASPPPVSDVGTTFDMGAPQDSREILRSAPFVMLTASTSMAALALIAVLINLVPMLVERGLSPREATLALGLGGLGQVAGRLGYSRFAAATSVTSRGVIVLGAVAASTAALALVPSSPALLIGVGMALGLARGVHTLVQATAVTDRWGPSAYGTLNGILTAPTLLACAVAPFAGAAMAQVMGSYSAAFLVLAALAAAAAALTTLAAPRVPAPAQAAPVGAR